jgi:peptidoglycan/LPS O-acetylase OafA/YrhL
MLPALTSPTVLFPYDPPAWSLFFEIVINGAFGFVLYRMPSALIVVICAVLGLVFLIAIKHTGYGDVGAQWNAIDLGLLRVGFSFPVGIVLARLFGKSRSRRSPISYGVLAGLTIALTIAIPIRFEWIYDVSAVLIVLPALVWFGAVYELPVNTLGKVLGDTSYPLYSIHFPILQIVSFSLVRTMHISAVAVTVIFVPAFFRCAAGFSLF